MIPQAALAVLVIVLVQQVQAKSSDNLVGTSSEDEITSLPGLSDSISFKQYSGYLNADTIGDNFHHYWFVESTNNPAVDPVLLWLNGGPGCSSMDGLLSELGPFQVNDDGQTLSMRKFSWNKAANILFMESPAGVGYSYSKYGRYNFSDDTTAANNYHALKSFFEKFPHFKNNSLYLAGESYAGVYLPTLGVLVDADPDMNLKGIAIGNGYLDVRKLGESMIFFNYYHGVVGEDTWADVKEFCCGGQAPSRQSCNFESELEGCWRALTRIDKNAANLNPYNMYADCAKSDGVLSSRLSRDQVDRELLRMASPNRNRTYNLHNQSIRFNLQKAQESPPCIDSSSLINYMNLPDVRKAIHIPRNLGQWDICTNMITYQSQYPGRKGGLSPQINQLIDSRRKLKLVVYNGDIDTVCNFFGDEWFVDDLGRGVIKDYSPWHYGRQIGGWVKHYDGIAFVTVRGAGHMVPQDRPAAAYTMIKNFLKPSKRFDL